MPGAAVPDPRAGLRPLVRHLLRIVLLGIALGVLLFVAYIGLAVFE